MDVLKKCYDFHKLKITQYNVEIKNCQSTNFLFHESCQNIFALLFLNCSMYIHSKKKIEEIVHKFLSTSDSNL